MYNNDIKLVEFTMNCLSDGYDDKEYIEEDGKRFLTDLKNIDSHLVREVIYRLCERIEELERQNEL